MNPNVLNKPLLATAQQLEEAFYVEMMASMLPVDLPVIPGVAIIPVEGLLLQRFEGFGSSYERIYGQIKKAVNTPDIKHIVLDINSGGGEVNGLFDLVDFIREARNQKPITALINEQAYSAAYLIATSASQIVIPRTGSVGSIGVMVAHLDQSEAEKQQGLTYTEIFAGKHKLDFSPHQPLTDAAKTELQAHVDETYALLIQTLSLNRNQPESIFQETEAQIYTSSKALELNLIDKIQAANHFYEELQVEALPENEKDEIEPEDKPEPEEVLAAERRRVKAILDLCQLAQQPESAARLITQGLSVERARKTLFEKIVSQTSEPIINALPERASQDSQLMKAMLKGLEGRRI